QKADLEIDVARSEPGIDGDVVRPAGQHFGEHDGGGDGRDHHADDGDPVGAAAADRPAEEARNDGPREGSKRNDQRESVCRHGWCDPGRGRASVTVHSSLMAPHPLRLSRSSTLIVFRLRNSTTRIASPIADSAAATVRMKNTKTCPDGSSKKCENATKFRLTASSISSIAISSTIMFLRFRKMPITAIANRIAPRTR